MPKHSPLLLHKICRRKGGFFMYCQQPYYGQFNRFGPMGRNVCGGGGHSMSRGGGYRGSTFVLIVVLFILLIIVGRSFV